MKYTFNNDYSEGAHPQILEYLVKVNSQIFSGYGYDHITKQAKNLLKTIIKNDDILVEFFPAGTITNTVAIASFLRCHEAVIAPSTGHINVHEAGSIEATGHKIIAVESSDGKLQPSDIDNVIEQHEDEHMVLPKLVYISNTVENGLVYTKEELIALSECCKKHDLYFFVDGARLACALNALNHSVSLEDLSKLTDAFYIGGTKNGMLCGDALIICNKQINNSIRYVMKQKGAILSKTWVVSAQFYAAFKDGLYFELASNANKMAKVIYDKLYENNVDFLVPYMSNQIFPIVDKEVANKLFESYDFLFWKHLDNNKVVIRLVCSWATKQEVVDKFVNDFLTIVKG